MGRNGTKEGSAAGFEAFPDHRFLEAKVAPGSFASHANRAVLVVRSFGRALRLRIMRIAGLSSSLLILPQSSSITVYNAI